MTPNRPPRLLGRTALIVGGTGGIGLATARRFLQEGAALVVSGRADGSAESAREALAGLGPITAVVADLADGEAVAGLVPRAVAILGGRLDIVVHVAGMSGRKFGDGPLDACTDDGWDGTLDANARSVFLTNRAAVRQMRGQALDDAGLRGSVVNTGSILAESPSPRLFNTVAYSAAKGALRSMTLNAAATYAPERVRFNLVVPSLIDTPMAARSTTNPTTLHYLRTKQPLAAGPGRADDVAEAALYLCEPASRFVTGAILAVDGGWHLSEGQHDVDPGAGAK